MKKHTTFLIILLFVSATYGNVVKKPTDTINSESINSLREKGFNILGRHYDVSSPQMDDSTNLPEIVQIKMSFNIYNVNNFKSNKLNQISRTLTTINTNDTTLFEDFEGDFPGTRWQLSGDPTWGKTSYQKHGGSNSAWCATGGDSAVTPPANYSNNMDAMMVFGPFDLSDASLAYMRFWYWLDTEIEKDWFWYMASDDGVNFSGIGVSGRTGSNSPTWEQSSFNLASVSGLGDLIGKSTVWIAFGFTSDSLNTNKGVYIDDVELYKSPIGTGLSGYISGTLVPEGNPYIAFDHVGVANGDSLSIMPGCEIKFEKGKEFVNQGYFAALGAENDSIRFTSNSVNPTPGDWTGIGFYSSTSKGSILQYSIVEFGGAGNEAQIYSKSSEPKFENNRISSGSSVGIRISGWRDIEWINVKIFKNEICNNSYLGIELYYTAGQVRGNIIRNNGRGIIITTSGILVEDNQIFSNLYYGIKSKDSGIKIIKNEIKKNGSNGIEKTEGFYTYPGLRVIERNEICDNEGDGIYLSGMGRELTITQNLIKGNNNGICGLEEVSRLYNNTIVANSESGIESWGSISGIPIIGNIITKNGKVGIYSHHENDTEVKITYNNIFDNGINYDIPKQDSLGLMVLTNSNGDSCDRNFNISENPLFVDPLAGDYRLQYIENGFPENSPCRDAGNPYGIFNDEDGTVNDLGFTGGSRLFISCTKYNFGSREISFSKQFKLYLYNDRPSTVSISKLELSDSENFAITHNSAFDIEPYNAASLNITFTPQRVDSLYCKLSIISDHDFFGCDTISVELFGIGLFVTIIGEGNVSGIWTKENNPYLINGTATVPKGDSLIIKPGVYIRFEASVTTLQVNGKLKAIGTPSDSIIITRADNSLGAGIKFINGDEGSLIEYCIIKNHQCAAGYQLGNGIYCDNTSITVKNSTFRENSAASGGGIFLKNSSSKIENNVFESNRAYGSSRNRGGGAIYCEDSSPIIYGNLLKNNFAKNHAGGIYCVNSKLKFYSNIICYNQANYWISGIYVKDSEADCINNIIYKNNGNSTGIGMRWVNSFGNIINCIIRENINGYVDPKRKQLIMEGIDSLTFVQYNNIQAGWEGVGNIDADALFIDSGNDDFRLQSTSPCIDAGNPDSLYNDPEAPLNPGFALWPAQGTIRNDMGVYGGPYTTGSVINFRPNAFSLLFPADGDSLNTLNPIFKWNKATDPNPGDMVAYELQIDLNQDFSNPVVFSNISDTSYTIQGNLNADLTYYWRIIASDSAGLTTLSKEVFHFTIGNVAPLVFNLFFPENMDTVFTLSPNLNWEEAEDPNYGDNIKYTLFYAQDSGFEQGDTVSAIFSNSYQLDSLDDHQSHFWKIKAEDNSGASTNSNQIFQFFTVAAPLPFKLLSPVVGDTVTSDTLHFNWHMAFDPNPADTISYTLVYDTSSTFMKPFTIPEILDTTYVFSDSLINNTCYFWTVTATDKDSFTTTSSDTFHLFVQYQPTNIDEFGKKLIPSEYSLSQNYPNPFNPETRIKYQLPKTSNVRLEIFNLLGQCVVTLLDQKQPAGYYTVSWNGRDKLGRNISSGIYLYKLQAEKFIKVRKLTLLR